MMLIVYLVLLFLGVSYEFSSFVDTKLSFAQFPNYLLANGIMLSYIVPMLALAIYYCRKKQISLWHLALGLVTGIFMTGWLAVYGNDYLGAVFEKLINNKAFWESWGGALVAPIIEESVKLAVTFLLVYLLKVKRLSEIMILGLSVGLGFQISEDNSYLLQSVNKVSEVYSQAFDRLSGFMTSHWLYTAMLSLALALLWACYRKQLTFKKRYFLWLATPLVSHFLWNSPLNMSAADLNLPTALISSLTVYIAIQMYQQTPDVAISRH